MACEIILQTLAVAFLPLVALLAPDFAVFRRAWQSVIIVGTLGCICSVKKRAHASASLDVLTHEGGVA